MKSLLLITKKLAHVDSSMRAINRVRFFCRVVKAHAHLLARDRQDRTEARVMALNPFEAGRVQRGNSLIVAIQRRSCFSKISLAVIETIHIVVIHLKRARVDKKTREHLGSSALPVARESTINRESRLCYVNLPRVLRNPLGILGVDKGKQSSRERNVCDGRAYRNEGRTNSGWPTAWTTTMSILFRGHRFSPIRDLHLHGPARPAVTMPYYIALAFKLILIFALGMGLNAFGQQTVTGPLASQSQTISSISYSQDDTTIVASWFTSGKSNSVLACGGKSAVDNNYQAAETFHQAVVTGLAPSTLYACAVTSGSTTSGSTNITTTAAATRTALTAVSFGSPTTTAIHGDTVDSFVSNDNIEYVTENDGYGFTGSANAGSNMQVGKLATESTLTGTLVNLLTGFGAYNTSNGTDGPSGVAQSNKLSGIFGMGGSLYLFANRDAYGTISNLTQTAWYANIMRSADHGATWNVWQNPTASAPTGIAPSPLGSFQFGLSTLGWCAPIRYGVDDGSLGYTTPGNRIDGANAFVYIQCTDGYFINSNYLYLVRIPRVQMASQNPGAFQYWHGPSSPSATDFVTDTNWTSSTTSMTAIYSAALQTNGADEIFVPGANYYVLATWFNPGTVGSTQVSSNSTWNVFAGPTPAGPWSNIGTKSNNPSGYYNPTAAHRTFATNSATSSIPITYVYSGDYNTGNATYYYPTYSTFTFNLTYASPTYRTTCNNTPGAGTTTTVNCTLTPTAGDLLFVMCRGGANVGTYTASSSPSGTYTQLSATATTSNGSSQASYSFRATGGSTTITCTAGQNQNYQGIQVLDYAPGSVTSLAAGGPNVLTSTSTYTSAAISTTGASFVVACGDAQYGPPTFTVGNINGSTATARTLTSPSSGCEDLSVATSMTGAVATIGASSAGTWDGVIAAFQ